MLGVFGRDRALHVVSARLVCNLVPAVPAALMHKIRTLWRYGAIRAGFMSLPRLERLGRCPIRAMKHRSFSHRVRLRAWPPSKRARRGFHLGSR